MDFLSDCDEHLIAAEWKDNKEDTRNAEDVGFEGGGGSVVPRYAPIGKRQYGRWSTPVDTYCTWPAFKRHLKKLQSMDGIHNSTYWGRWELISLSNSS